MIKIYKSFEKWLIKYSIPLFLISMVVWILHFYYYTRFLKLSQEAVGQIGDNMGGFFGPLVGFFSALLVYKSFQEQKKANDLLTGQVEVEHTFIFLGEIDKLISRLKDQNNNFLEYFNSYDEPTVEFIDKKISFEMQINTILSKYYYDLHFSGLIKALHKIKSWQQSTVIVLIDLEQYSKYIWINYENNKNNDANFNLAISLLEKRLKFARKPLFVMKEITDKFNDIIDSKAIDDLSIVNKLKEAKEFSKECLEYYNDQNFSYTSKILNLQ